MRDGVFFFGGHLAERARFVFGDEDRIPTEAAVAAWLFRDCSLGSTFNDECVAVLIDDT